MKTIDEAASDYSCRKDNESESYMGFKSGVEFAQRWIPVNDELPECGTEIIVKNEHRKEVRKIGSIYDIKDITEFATHWRPIELK